MHDPRLTKLADVLVNYSTAVRPGDIVRLTGSPTGRPLLVELYRAVIRAGGLPRVNMPPEECAEIRLADGNDAQLRWEDPIELHELESIDVSISMWGARQHQGPQRRGPRAASPGQPGAAEIHGDGS